MKKKKEESEGEDRQKLKGKEYEKQLRELQAELCTLQDWVKHRGLRVIIIFEGRDGAGKEEPSGRSLSGSAPGFSGSSHSPLLRTARNHKYIFSGI
jgi:hypothetical protein